MKFDINNIEALMKKVEIGMQRIKEANPDIIPMFHIIASRDTGVYWMFVCEVTDFNNDIITFDSVNERQMKKHIEKIGDVYSCSNHVEAFTFHPHIERTIRKVKNELEKPTLTIKQRLSKLAKIVGEMK
ncbi:hypothetical protein AVV44_gp259 [Cronobacter phage S13]|uniref:Uncharacterized protein n=1 Tax=Cronobacter phage LPCS28 TaxID=2924885 RepID=A0AAE9GAL5_9CAUD|nr:hypothetical protein AVV44_gp259 [Cronobacter phage S13]YP_010665761.1 hypothetical protein PQB73_gp263 [Cronobacter phage LPCS28]AIA64979.1 hypothetical protein S13_182 [Cronobacter phage S13]UNY46950.1 hypothetical protein EHEKIMEA_00062 [Cronobacter phage LPCS28]